jgi:hypothetical protein
LQAPHDFVRVACETVPAYLRVGQRVSFLVLGGRIQVEMRRRAHYVRVGVTKLARVGPDTQTTAA